MLFNAKEFEYYFTDPNLKKGLSLFERGKVDLSVAPADGEYRFLINGSYKVRIQKRGDQVLSYSCSCQKKTGCEHLCAVMFYFQKEILGIAVKRVRPKKPSERKQISASKGALLKGLNTMPYNKLLDFMEYYAGLAPDFKKAVELYFSNDAGGQTLHDFQLQIRSLLNYYPEKLNQAQLDRIHSSLQELIQKTTSNNDDSRRAYYLHLALFSELPEVFNRRLIGNEAQLLALFQQSQQVLDVFFKEGLSSLEKTNWINATVQFKSVHSLGLDVLFFLIPRAISGLKSDTTFNSLKLSISRRKRQPHYSGQPDKLLILQLQLAIKGSQVFKTSLPPGIPKSGPEWTIARAELDLSDKKINKAFRFLEKEYEEIKISYPAYINAFLDYLILKSRQYGQTALELNYLKESILYGLHIPANRLKRLFQMLPAASRIKQINELLALVKDSAVPFSDEKVMVILLTAGKIKSLRTDLKNHPGRFTTLHRWMFQQLPGYEKDVFPIYAEQLISTLEIKKEGNERKALIQLAKKYLEQLPDEQTAGLISEILTQAQKHEKLYPFMASHLKESTFNN